MLCVKHQVWHPDQLLETAHIPDQLCQITRQQASVYPDYLNWDFIAPGERITINFGRTPGAPNGLTSSRTSSIFYKGTVYFLPVLMSSRNCWRGVPRAARCSRVWRPASWVVFSRLWAWRTLLPQPVPVAYRANPVLQPHRTAATTRPVAMAPAFARAD